MTDRVTQTCAPRASRVMRPLQHVDVIEVRMWGQRVGAISLDPVLGSYAFEYTPAFVASGLEISPLQMPLAQAVEPFVFPSLPKETFKGLPALIADALPDTFGNALIDAYLASRGVERDAITALDRLAYMGRRGMGALEFKPATSPAQKSSAALKIESLVESARQALTGTLSTDADTAATLAHIFQVGTSAGGARAKAVIALHPETGEIRPGQFDVDAPFEHWLLKFDDVGADAELGASSYYGRIEYAYYLMACAAGITIEPSRLLEEGGRAHFMTRRFDRTGNVRHHMQTLCAMAHLDYRQKAAHDYSQFFITMRQIGLDDGAMVEGFRRMVFNVFAANCDDHTKNISFLMKEGRPWDLAPVYDVTHAFNPKGEWTYQHLMGVGGKFTGITAEDLLKVAERFQIPDARTVVADVATAARAWPEFAALAGVPADITGQILIDINDRLPATNIPPALGRRRKAVR